MTGSLAAEGLARTHSVAGKIALVVGGSQGIGQATVARLARGGASVVVCGHEAGPVEATVQALRDERFDAVGVTADIAVSTDVERLIAEVEQAHGGIDILINSAGIQTYGTVVETTEELWDRTLGVNLKGIFLVSKHAIPLIRRRGGGSIVNVSSVQGLSCQEGVAAYATSKGGAISLTTAMAVDHAADGIRVNVVLPGSVDTPMLRASARKFSGDRPEDKVLGEWGTSHLLGRVAHADEIAEAITFLASDASSFVTGTAFRVDGGLLARLPGLPAARAGDPP